MVDENKQHLEEMIRHTIRNMFDHATVDSAAQSWIEIAKKRGYDDLVAEMEADLKFELEKAG
ncbi:hypothetical protein FW774_06050 [Pedobacter sp. BS3]|nr:hypothetical protein FW774_06050 [Pedobacter sp. BS3]